MLQALRETLWGFPMIALLVVSGCWFSVRTGFFQLHPIRLCRHTVGGLFRKKEGRRTLLASVSTALGGTVGVGSITGVAYGIAVGGAGSVFWMWVSGITGMALKYAEVYLAVAHRRKLPDGGYAGGAPYGLTDLGLRPLGVLFALLCVCSSFGVGNLAQIGALTEAAGTLGVSAPVCGGACALLLAYVLFGGRKRIGKLNTAIVPAASALYLLAVLWILLCNLPALPGVFLRILREAFGVRAAVGGVSGSLLSLALREGFARGVFSNEAGVGSSPLAHASSGESDPQKQGEWGAFEILADTFLVSTLTALALLSAGGEPQRMAELFGNAFGTFGVLLFTLLAAVFAFSSILSWCYYSDVCLTFLALPHGQTVYRLLSVGAAFFGAFVPMRALWAAADVLNALMILPNLLLLFLQRKEVVYISEKERLSTCGTLKNKKSSCAN